MNDIQRGVLILIKSAITGESATLPGGFSIESAEKLIMTHQIDGIAYEGAVLCGISKKEPTMQRLFQKYYQHVLQNEKQMAALKALFDAFETNGIHYLPVKGSNMKQLYPSAAMRAMGDADILIRMEQYEKIKPLMGPLGYTEGPAVNHELVWISKALHLELHKSLVPESNADYYRYFGEGWKNAQLVEGNRYTLPNEIMFAFLLAHYAKHYRDAGVGLRQTVDLWLYIKKVPMDQELLMLELAKLKLDEFYQNIFNLLDSWFEEQPLNEKTEYISNYLFNSGSWGTKENWLISQGLRSSKEQGSVKKARRKMLREAILPPLKLMQNRYTILRKLPWLLPVYWPIRWVEALLFRRENIRNYRNNMKTTSVERIESFEESLQYVGLSVDI